MVIEDKSNSMRAGQNMIWKKQLRSTGLENRNRGFFLKLLTRRICKKGIAEAICTLDDTRCSDRDVAIEKLACETS